jgi:uncharacterized protein
MSDLHLSDAAEAQRYEARLEDRVVAYIEYRPSGEARMLTHTEVNADMEGKGVGSAIVKYALEDIRARGERVVPMCPFVAAYLQRHPEYVDLVHPLQRRVFGL